MKNFRIKRRMRNRLICAVLTGCLLTGMTGTADLRLAYASSAKEIQDKAKQDLNNTNQQIQNIQNQQNQVEDELDVAAAQLDKLLTKQRKLQTQITDTQKQVDQANADLLAAQQKEQEEYDSMKLRIQFMYENSADKSIWSAIIESNGISDMLNRIEYVSSMYKSDRKLLNEYQDVVQQVQTLTEQLNAKLTELLALQEDYENQQAEVETLIASLNQKKDTYAAQLAQAQQQAQEFQKTIEEQGRIIQQQEAEAARKAREEELRRLAAAAKAAADKKAAEEAARKAQEEAQNASAYEGGGSGESNTKSSDVADSGQDPEFSGDVSGAELVAYANQFVGGKYKWGGNSLTNGVDCSGFVHLVYAHFGYSLPRYSQAFKSVGKAVSADNIKAGDIIVYPGHVAIAMGNGKIVEAQSSRAGITNSRSVHCHTILAIRRVL